MLIKLSIQEADEFLHINKARFKKISHDENIWQIYAITLARLDTQCEQGKFDWQQSPIFGTSIKDNSDIIDFDHILVRTSHSHPIQFSCDNDREVSVIYRRDILISMSGQLIEKGCPLNSPTYQDDRWGWTIDTYTYITSKCSLMSISSVSVIPNYIKGIGINLRIDAEKCTE